MQLASLPALARLELRCKLPDVGCLRVLGGAPSLTSLEVTSYAALLAGLEAVTQLRQLEPDLMGDSPNNDAIVQALLAALPRLHTLALDHSGIDSLPRTLASLPRVQRLCLSDWGEDVALSLPPNPWVASLRWLAAPSRVLKASVPLLLGATALEHLSCLGLPVPDGDAAPSRARWAEFWACLEALPALRCLCIHQFYPEPSSQLPPALSQAALALASRCRALHLHSLELPLRAPKLLFMADIPASLPAQPLGYDF